MARDSTVVLIHSSKTMRSEAASGAKTVPVLLDRARELVDYVRTLTPRQLGTVMTLSGAMADRTHELFAAWSTSPEHLSPAIETFTGDIYSGLQAASFGPADRRYADGHLRILSGLYGILRPYDGISPYRLEMGFRLPNPRFANLYRFWGSAVADQLPAAGLVVNLAANEYSKVVLDHVDPERVVTPRFLTVDPRSGEPKFIVVHAKIARGAFARWLITQRVEKRSDLATFEDLGYRLDPSRGGAREPCYVCTDFQGKGLSVRLQ